MTSPAATVTAPVADAPAATAPRNALLDSLMPLLVDVGVPLASYYALKAAGLGTFAALAWSSVLLGRAHRVGRGAQAAGSTGWRR